MPEYSRPPPITKLWVALAGMCSPRRSLSSGRLPYFTVLCLECFHDRAMRCRTVVYCRYTKSKLNADSVRTFKIVPRRLEDQKEAVSKKCNRHTRTLPKFYAGMCVIKICVSICVPNLRRVPSPLWPKAELARTVRQCSISNVSPARTTSITFLTRNDIFQNNLPCTIAFGVSLSYKY